MPVEINTDMLGELGQATATRIRSADIDANCFKCGVSVNTRRGDHVAVVLVRYLDVDEIKYSHHKCFTSQVVYAGRAAPSKPSDNIVFWSLILPSHPISRPILLINPRFPDLITPQGEVIQPFTGHLVDQGWTFVARLGKTPQSLVDWRVEIDPGSDAGRILTPDGSVFLDSLPKDESWRSLAIQRGSITVLACPIESAIDQGADPIQELRSRAQGGEVIGGNIPVKAIEQQEHPLRTAGRRVAGYLQEAVTRAARRPHEAVDPGALLQFKSEPLIAPALFHAVAPETGLFAIVIVDFQESDLTYAMTLKNALAAQGFLQGPADSPDHLLPTAPRGWAAAVWPSQMMVYAPRGDGSLALVLFEGLAIADHRWYQAVRDKRAMGLLFGNNLGPDMLDDTELMIRSGETVGMGLPVLLMQ